MEKLSDATGRLSIRTEIPFDYYLREAKGPPRELVVLLHGYSESGSRILHKLQDAVSADCAILAPNGPFPLPERTEHGYKLGFAWYMYDPASKEYFIDMRPGITFLQQGLSQLGFTSIPKRLIGFSQGGYLAPIIAQSLLNVKQVIGIASEFLKDEMDPEIPFRVDGIFGELDLVVTPAESEATHRCLTQAGVRGSFQIVPGLGHKIDGEVVKRVSELLKLN